MSNNAVFISHLVFTASVVLNVTFLMALRGFGRPVRYMTLFFLVVIITSIANYMQVHHTPFHGQLLWNPLHLFVALASYPLLFAYLFDLMCPGTMRLRYWLNAYVPLVALTALRFIIVAVREPLPFFTHYAEIRRYFGEPELWVRFAAAVLLVVMTCVFIVRAISMLKHHRNNLTSNFSYTEGSTLGWIWWWLLLTACKIIALLLMISVEGQMIKLVCLAIYAIEPLITTICVLRQKDLYDETPKIENNGVEPFLADDKSVDLPSERRQKLKRDLLDLLEKEEVFKDSELNIEKVRAMLITNRTYLSQVINHEMNTTFYRLINTYRLNKAVEMMNNPLHQDMPLNYIADICGFKSLKAFSTLFKQTCGKTPTEWRNEQGGVWISSHI